MTSEKNYSPNTKLFISLSQRPGSTGALIQNRLYQRYSLDNVYLPMKVHTYLVDAISGIRALNVKGFALSSPYKREIMFYLDDVTGDARLINSVNTVVNYDNRLVGYNTDIFGFGELFKNILSQNEILEAVIVGSGPAARSVYKALEFLKIKSLVVARKKNENYDMMKMIGDCTIKFPKHIKSKTVVINATNELEEIPTPMTFNDINKFSCAIDINFNSTFLIANEMNKIPVYNGKLMAINQSIMQFELYTGIMLTKLDREQLIKLFVNLI